MSPKKPAKKPGKRREFHKNLDFGGDKRIENENGDIKSPEKTAEEMLIYKQISHKNHRLNTLETHDLRKICRDENINCQGKKIILTKRLKQYFKEQILRSAGLLPLRSLRGYEYLVVIDFEATCEAERNTQYPHEIIEFPAVIVNVDRCEVEDNWRRYVKPKINPILSDFCTELTGIKQETVDKADDFLTVLEEFQDWLHLKKLGTEHTFAIATDGPFDIARFFLLSCQQNHIKAPFWAQRWVNIRKCFHNFYKGGQRQQGLKGMLDFMNLGFQGTPHCGLDDSINIARVATRLLKEGCRFRVNEMLCLPGRKDRCIPTMTHVKKEEADNWLTVCRKRLSKNDLDETEEGVERLNSSDEDPACDTESADDASARADKNASDIIDKVLKSCEQNFTQQTEINQVPTKS